MDVKKFGYKSTHIFCILQYKMYILEFVFVFEFYLTKIDCVLQKETYKIR
jgi:hypothetical protein